MQKKFIRIKDRKKLHVPGILLMIAVLLSAGCGNSEGKVNKIHKPENGDLSIYDSPYTYGEKLEDGTYDFYIYASPVQWKSREQYVPIDNNLAKTGKKNYIYENTGNQIKTYFPSGKKKGFLMENGEKYFYAEISQLKEKGKKEKFKNIYGEEKEAVCYALENGGLLYAYPVYSGIHFECVYPDGVSKKDLLTMEVEKQMFRSDEISDEYLQFFQKEMKVILYQPFLKQEGAELKQLNVWRLENEDENKKDTVEVKMSQLPENKGGEVRLEFSLLWDVEAMPDSTVYEKKDENVFCARSALIGKGAETGTGQHYLRYRFNYFYQIDPESILKAEYCVKDLNVNAEKKELSLHEPAVQWSSTRLCWDARVSYGKGNQNQEINLTEDGWYVFNITDFTKKAVEDYSGTTESIGSVLICEDGSVFFATSDNGEFIPYIKLHLNALPEYFINHESINEVDW